MVYENEDSTFSLQQTYGIGYGQSSSTNQKDKKLEFMKHFLTSTDSEMYIKMPHAKRKIS